VHIGSCRDVVVVHLKEILLETNHTEARL
jgi:hypothetical protein